MISIQYEITTDGFTFKDAIVLPADHGYALAQLEEIKQKRFDDWYAIVTAPSEEVEEE